MSSPRKGSPSSKGKVLPKIIEALRSIDVSKFGSRIFERTKLRFVAVPKTPRDFFTVSTEDDSTLRIEIFRGLDPSRPEGVLESLALSILILREDPLLDSRAFPAALDGRNLYRCLRDKIGLKYSPVRKWGKNASPLRGKGWRFWENSCYFDSLLTPMFAGEFSVFLELIESVNPDALDYQPAEMCGSGSTLDSEDLREVAKMFVASLREDLSNLGKGRLVQCRRLRDLARSCFPELRGRGGWIIFEPGIIYGWLSDLFPTLRMPYLSGIRSTRRFTCRSRAIFDVWDFIGDDPTRQEEIIWSEYSAPVLVFQNGGSPPITVFDRTGDEISEVADYSTRKLRYVKTRFTKKRALGLTILDGRYTYVGGSLLHGTTLGREGGSHYISCLRVSPGKFVLVDDLSGVASPIESVGEWAFREGGTKPILFFYVRTK